MKHLILLLISLIINQVICDNKPIKESQLKLKFVFITVRGAAHWPCDYPGGQIIFNRPETSSRLSWRGRNEAYDYGREIDEMYRSRFNIQQWNTSNYLTLASTSPRTKQAALVLAAGLENKPYAKNRKWSKEKMNSTQFEAMQQYLKFYSPQHCPRYFEEINSKGQDHMKMYNKEVRDAVRIFHKKISHRFDITRGISPPDIWLAYESMYNVFYSYKKKYANKLKYWKQIRNVFKEFSIKFMWSALTANEELRKLSSGPIIEDVINDMEKVMVRERKAKNAIQEDEKYQEKYKENDLNKKRKLSILTVPQGILAALIMGFAPNGTKVDSREFNAYDLYPEQGAMHIIEFYKSGRKWLVKVLYRRKKEDCLKTINIPGCHKIPCNYETFKNALQKTQTNITQHETLCYSSELE